MTSRGPFRPKTFYDSMIFCTSFNQIVLQKDTGSSAFFQELIQGDLRTAVFYVFVTFSAD